MWGKKLVTITEYFLDECTRQRNLKTQVTASNNLPKVILLFSKNIMQLLLEPLADSRYFVNCSAKGTSTCSFSVEL